MVVSGLVVAQKNGRNGSEVGDRDINAAAGNESTVSNSPVIFPKGEPRPAFIDK